jgi:hypothetical protein
MSKKLLVSLTTVVLLLSFIQSANAAAVAIGNPTAANGWDTTSAVTATANPSTQWFGIAAILNGAGLDAATGLIHGHQLWATPKETWLESLPSPPNITSPSGRTCKMWV